MCLIVFDWQPEAEITLRLAANRDEFYSRPTQALHRWPNAELIGGRDLLAGGSWLAATHSRVAALTNVRESQPATPPDAPSRGELVHQALTADDPGRWLETLASRGARRYAGFNLLVMSGNQLWTLHHSQHETCCESVAPGLHGLSNAKLDTPWPKLIHARDAMRLALNAPDWRTEMRPAMSNTRQAPDSELPATGMGRDRERFLSPLFIEGQDYGTRATTLVTVSDRSVLLEEQRFGPGGVPTGPITRLGVSAAGQS
ncbi:NRDE family protein [Salinicola halimionae]|uniref:NRDE family protein n=1 Tax=Salinicola halimionae TaxID=1949081 RepID=UPI000DA1671F|nr:NRDE family protein [Salinicola halimionae]